MYLLIRIHYQSHIILRVDSRLRIILKFGVSRTKTLFRNKDAGDFFIVSSLGLEENHVLYI